MFKIRPLFEGADEVPLGGVLSALELKKKGALEEGSVFFEADPEPLGAAEPWKASARTAKQNGAGSPLGGPKKPDVPRGDPMPLNRELLGRDPHVR